MASCSSLASVSDPCAVLRKAPEMKSETRVAIFKDRPFSDWVIMVDKDGKSRGCW